MSSEDLKILNETLARLVGFRWTNVVGSGAKCVAFPDFDVANPTLSLNLPNFTSSMDACIKWIYPLLHKPVEVGNTKLDEGVKGWCCRIGNSGWCKAESLSLAFCLAAYKSFEEVK
jgi:hypothetical protein